MEQKNTLDLSDQELKTLYDVLLSTKLTASTQELLLIKMGKNQSPVLDVTLKVAQVWETRAMQLQKEQADTPTPDVALAASN